MIRFKKKAQVLDSVESYEVMCTCSCTCGPYCDCSGMGRYDSSVAEVNNSTTIMSTSVSGAADMRSMQREN